MSGRTDLKYDYRLKLFLKKKDGVRFDLVFAFFIDLAAASRTGRKLKLNGFDGHEVEGFSVNFVDVVGPKRLTV